MFTHSISDLDTAVQFDANGDIIVPLDFEVALTDQISAGDLVLTQFGWWGRVGRVKDTQAGRGYSVYVMEYHGNGEWITGKTRRWIWESEIEAVL